MGRVFKAFYTKPGVYEKALDGSVILYDEGRKKGQPKHKRFESKKWTIEYTSAAGRTVHKGGYLKKGQAEEALLDAEVKAKNFRNGVSNVKECDILCADLMEQFIADKARSVSASYLSELRIKIKYMLEKTGAITARDLQPEAVDRVLDDLKVVGVRMQKGLADKTVIGYGRIIKDMLSYAVKKKVISHNTMEGLSNRGKPKARRIRRVITHEEMSKIFSVSIEERRNIYTVLLLTGLRVNELRTLTWDDVSLDPGNELIYIRADRTKNKTEATLPMHCGVSDIIRARLSSSLPASGKRIFDIPKLFINAFNDDLVLSGLAIAEKSPRHRNIVYNKLNALGETLDLHCLRHTFCSRLAVAKVSPPIISALMRHNSVTDFGITGVYLHSNIADMRKAVNLLVRPICGVPEEEIEQRATGTYDVKAERNILPISTKNSICPTRIQQGTLQVVDTTGKQHERYVRYDRSLSSRERP